jgi:hypothetical protein
MSNKLQMVMTVTWPRACSTMYFNSSNEQGKEFLEGVYIIRHTIPKILVLNKLSVARISKNIFFKVCQILLD